MERQRWPARTAAVSPRRRSLAWRAFRASMSRRSPGSCTAEAKGGSHPIEAAKRAGLMREAALPFLRLSRRKGEGDGPARRREVARPVVRYQGDRRPLRAEQERLSQLDNRGRQSRTLGRGRFRGGGRPLPPLCFACLPLGAPDPHTSQAQGAGGRHPRVRRSLAHEGERLGTSHRRRSDGRAYRRPALRLGLPVPALHPRAAICGAFKGLEAAIRWSVVGWLMTETAWGFRTDGDPTGALTGDPLYGSDFLYQLYTRAKGDYSGRVTVPVLWDEKRQTIVSNESAEIIRMLNNAFDGIGATSGDFYPEPLRGEIDSLNDFVYDRVNNGVYKAGFATTQEAYAEAVTALFEALDELEARLGRQRWLVGDRLTEADWRLFTTLVRFDPVYVGHFKCNLKRLVDYPHLWDYTRELYQVPGVADTVNLHHIKHHYYQSHDTINPTGVVPLGPEIDFTVPHGRG